MISQSKIQLTNQTKIKILSNHYIKINDYYTTTIISWKDENWFYNIISLLFKDDNKLLSLSFFNFNNRFISNVLLSNKIFFFSIIFQILSLVL